MSAPEPKMPDLTELQDAIRQQQRRRRLAPALDRSVLKLPSPPILLLEMLRTIKDENSSARDLEHFFSIDLSLVAKLLRLANSSFFGLRYKVKTIREAVAVLGFRTLRSLAMAAFADNLFSSQLRVYGYSRNGLWKHSFGCAVMAREVARRLHYPPQAVEELFVAGMLHDIGKVVLGRFLAASPEWPGACSDPGGKPAVIAGERRIVGFDHAEIGRNIAEKWNLPPGLRNLILFHHQPSAAAERQDAAGIIHLADYLCARIHLGLSPASQLPVHFEPGTLRDVRLQAREIEELCEVVKETVRQCESLLAD